MDARRRIHREVPLLHRWIGGAIFVLQHYFPRSKSLEVARKKNVGWAVRKMKPRARIEVERRKNLGEEEFIRDYLKKGIPVIFDGQASTWPCSTKWNLDLLESRFGDKTIAMMGIPDQNGDEYISAKGKFGEILAEMISAREFVASSRQGLTSKICPCGILETPAELMEDLDLGWLKQMRRSVLGVSFPSCIGSGGRKTRIHAESTAFFFVMAEGEKEWTLVSPFSSIILNPVPKGRGYNYSELKPSSPDLSRYPGFDRLTRYTCRIKKGDVLFVPSWMWHEVDTLSDSWAVSYRFTYLRGFVGNPAFAFVRAFLSKPSIIETLYYSFRNIMASRKQDSTVPKLYIKN